MNQLRRYSSLVMLLLFTLVLSGDALQEYLCSCNIEHTHQSEHHDCCSCPTHKEECESHHEIASHNCQHDGFSNPFNEAIVSQQSESNTQVNSRYNFISLLYNYEVQIEISPKRSESHLPLNQRCENRWRALCSPLRAPPTLV